MNEKSIIKTSSALEAYLDQISNDDGVVGIDTEFMRENTYYPELCLIQLHSESGSTCIDVLSDVALGPLSEFLSRPDVCSVFHSCRQDLEALSTVFEIRISNLFDTQVAAGFCGYADQISYASMVEAICDVKLPKSHTRTDWRKRPLSQGQIAYALDDVIYLPGIYRNLREKLKQIDRLDWLNQECKEILGISHSQQEDKLVEDAWKRVKNGGRLPLVSQHTLKDLAAWREKMAISKNLPREWVLPGSTLMEISSKMPGGLQQLKALETLNKKHLQRYGNHILEIVHRVRDSKPSETIWSEKSQLTPEQRKQLKAMMKLLGQIAEQNALSQSLIANRAEVEKLLRGNTEIPLMQTWRRTLAGQSLTNLLD